MTNFLSSAMLSAGAACFGSIIEIEKNMSQAEINTLLASKQMMDVQPLMMTALQNSYEKQAQDQFISGLISGVGAMVAGGVQLGLVGYGATAAKAESEPMRKDPELLKATVEELPPNINPEKSKATLVGKNEFELEDLSKKPVTNDPSENEKKLVDQKKNIANETRQQTDEETAKAEKDQKKRDKAADAKYQEISNRFGNTYVQIFGPAINGAATAGSSYYKADETRNGGTAQAMGTVISGNKTAQDSNASMVQTYKEAFTNASQILAGIVSAQNH